MSKTVRSLAPRSIALVLAVMIALTPWFGAVSPAQAQTCQYWIAPNGNNSNPGTNQQPWATLSHAASRVRSLNGANCIVWVKDGVYNGLNDLEERFSTMITFKAVNPYKAIFQNSGTALEISGGKNMTFDGFEFRHTGPGAGALVVRVSGSDEAWAENIVFRNNIFHDSYNNDLLKIHNGSRFVTVENNVFYNQGDDEQHMDVNSVTDVVIQDNIFFNDYAGSGRPISGSAKHFIVIKDSNDNSDGLLGAQRITVRRNIFMHYEGDGDALVQVGNDGKPFHEAIDVRFENNLIIGNNTDPAGYSFGVSGAKNVSFVNNTVTGNFPSSAYAYRIVTKDQNPLNQNITFYNNIWSDPTRTMQDFSSGNSSSITGFVLNNNLYWNGGASIPSGDVGSPMSTDSNRVVGDPRLNPNQSGTIMPRWNGSSFLSGYTTIRHEFFRLVALYGQTSAGSAAIDRALTSQAPSTDILGQARGSSPDLGAFEYTGNGVPAPNIFWDVPPGYWAQSFIQELYESGITGGCLLSPLMYCPEGIVNRAQMAVFLLKSMHGPSYSPPAVGGSTGFSDVAPNYWAAAWIKQLAREGITAGCNANNYCPEGAVTRDQMAIFLLRAKHGVSYNPPPVGNSTGFSDVAPSHWAAAWIKQLAAEGITGGCSAGRYCPGNPVNRAEMAVFLLKTFNTP